MNALCILRKTERHISAKVTVLSSPKSLLSITWEVAHVLALGIGLYFRVVPGVDVLFKNLQRFVLDQVAVKNGEICLLPAH